MENILDNIIKAIDYYILVKGITPNYIIINDKTFELLKNERYIFSFRRFR